MNESEYNAHVQRDNETRGPEKLTITAEKVVRWFNIDARAFYQGHCFSDIHDEMFDVVSEETNAKEVMSGHCGFLVALEDDERTDEEIIKSLLARIEKSGLMERQQEAPDV